MHSGRLSYGGVAHPSHMVVWPTYPSHMVERPTCPSHMVVWPTYASHIVVWPTYPSHMDAPSGSHCMDILGAAML